MLLQQARQILKESGFQFLDNKIVKNGMTYGFYTIDRHFEGHISIPFLITEVRTCSKEVATTMVINKVPVKKY